MDLVPGRVLVYSPAEAPHTGKTNKPLRKGRNMRAGTRASLLRLLYPVLFTKK